MNSSEPQIIRDVALMEDAMTRSLLGGDDASKQRHVKRGKMLPRERVHTLLDPSSPWLELSPLAAHNLYDNQAPCAGVITGIGKIQNQWSMVIANDATVKGGVFFPITVKKHLRAQKIALENRLPCFYLVDSGGANLPYQADLFPDENHFGRSFFNQARMSALEIPQIALVMGSCTAGGAYVPAMADEAVIVAGHGTVFLGGPPLVKAATGEITDPQSLGGADVHARRSGVVDHYAVNDKHALAIARSIALNIPQIPVPTPEHTPKPPKRDPQSILSLIPDDLKSPFPILDILDAVVDADSIHHFKRLFGATLICAFARIQGRTVGVVANNGVLFPESARKGAHFVSLCAQRRIPLVFLQNISGFMVGKQYENEGIAKDGAKMVHAVSCADVPKFTVIIGGSFGAGNYAMCGRAYQPRFLWSWPNSKISVMGGEQAASVLATVKRDNVERRGDSWSKQEEDDFKKPVRDAYEKEGHALFATARLWDDGVIHPAKTRHALAYALDLTARNPTPRSQFGVFRM